MDCFAALAMTVDTVSRSRGAFRPSFASSLSLGNQRAQGRPGACCTHGLACDFAQTKSAHEHTGQREHSGLPCAMALRLTSSSPLQSANVSTSNVPGSGWWARRYRSFAYPVRLPRHCARLLLRATPHSGRPNLFFLLWCRTYNTRIAQTAELCPSASNGPIAPGSRV